MLPDRTLFPIGKSSHAGYMCHYSLKPEFKIPNLVDVLPSERTAVAAFRVTVLVHLTAVVLLEAKITESCTRISFSSPDLIVHNMSYESFYYKCKINSFAE